MQTTARTSSYWTTLGAATLLAATLGCGPQLASDKDGDPKHPIAKQQDHDHDHDHDHDDDDDHAAGHPTVGPNGGHLIDFGDHKYFMEWMHDDETGRLTFILWDHDLKREIPIPAEEIEIVSTVLGDRKEYKIPAIVSTDAGSTGNSRFEIVDPGLLALVTAEAEPHPMLMIDIDAKQYPVEIKHFHHD